MIADSPWRILAPATAVSARPQLPPEILEGTKPDSPAIVGILDEHFELSEFSNVLVTVLFGSGGVITGRQLTQAK
jgi:hypothetical protein